MKIKVMVFPAGEVNSVELHDALSTCVNVELYGASSIDRHGSFVFKRYISGLPLISDDAFISSFNTILEENKIDLVFATHDTVHRFLCENSDKISAKIVNGDKHTAIICRDKLLQYELLMGLDFMPRIYDDVTEFPVFLKRRQGQGGVGSILARSEMDLPLNIKEYVISEYLPGEEMSVDCLTDKDGRLIVISARTRERMMAGICVRGRSVPAERQIVRIAEEINYRLKLRGLWFFQVKKDVNGNWKYLETAARIASTMGLTRARGLNLPLMSVYVSMGLEVESIVNDYTVEMDRTLISRYRIDYSWNRVYFDFDDTLIVEGGVNLKAIWFLYQCRNSGKQVILLTKHIRKIRESLKRYAIAENLFTSIIHIGVGELKSRCIKPCKSIFIDNSYQERKAVAQAHGIPVFDVDGLDVLMDWRS